MLPGLGVMSNLDNELLLPLSDIVSSGRIFPDRDVLGRAGDTSQPEASVQNGTWGRTGLGLVEESACDGFLIEQSHTSTQSSIITTVDRGVD
jgi:hypothetical protein